MWRLRKAQECRVDVIGVLDSLVNAPSIDGVALNVLEVCLSFWD
ncbi:MAG: hypothetical protein ACI8W7_004973 [Gammaproteobacteria bacterium]|jgi:hypothetical protein